MAVNLADANAYIDQYVIDNEDWKDADDAKKQRILNVAARTLSTKYPQYTIPDEAVYEYAAVLAVVFNDTNRLTQQGVTSFAVDGVGSFNFKDTGVRTPGEDIEQYIPKTAIDLINAVPANAELPKIGYRSVKWLVL